MKKPTYKNPTRVDANGVEYHAALYRVYEGDRRYRQNVSKHHTYSNKELALAKQRQLEAIGRFLKLVVYVAVRSC